MKRKVELEELIKNTPCPCGYSCLKQGCCCRATVERVIGGTILSIEVCEDKDRIDCGYYVEFGGGCYCSCPLHVELCRRGLLNKPEALRALLPKEYAPQTDSDEDATP